MFKPLMWQQSWDGLGVEWADQVKLRRPDLQGHMLAVNAALGKAAGNEPKALLQHVVHWLSPFQPNQPTSLSARSCRPLRFA
jgi:hypothetical protein